MLLNTLRFIEHAPWQRTLSPNAAVLGLRNLTVVLGACLTPCLPPVFLTFPSSFTPSFPLNVLQSLTQSVPLTFCSFLVTALLIPLEEDLWKGCFICLHFLLLLLLRAL